MRRTFPILVAGLALALLSSACKRRDGDVVCSPGALTFSKPATTVATPAGTVDDVRIAAIGTDFLIVWSSGPTADDTDLWGVVVGLDGVVASNPVRITQAAGVSTGIRLAVGPGGVGVSWTDGRLTQRVAMADVLPGLVPSTSPAVFQSPVIAADQEPVPAIAAIGTAYVIAWNGRGSDGFDHLYAQGMTTSGAAAGAPFPLSASQEDRATPPTISAGLLSSGGGFAVVIADEELRPGTSDEDVFAYLVAGTGALASARYGITSKATSPEAIGAGVVWIDDRDGGRGDLFFAQVGGGEIRLTQGPAENEAPSVTPAAGGFLLTWLANGDLKLRAFQSDGRPNGSTLTPGSGATRADVAWTAAGAGVVWAGPDGLQFRPLACP